MLVKLHLAAIIIDLLRFDEVTRSAWSNHSTNGPRRQSECVLGATASLFTWSDNSTMGLEQMHLSLGAKHSASAGGAYAILYSISYVRQPVHSIQNRQHQVVLS